MDFRFSPKQQAFRQEVRRFCQVTLDQRTREESQLNGGEGLLASSRTFSRALAARRWLGLAWPQEFGGQGRGPMDRLIFMEEMVEAEAPLGYHLAGERQVGPSLILHGTPEQR